MPDDDTFYDCILCSYNEVTLYYVDFIFNVNIYIFYCSYFMARPWARLSRAYILLFFYLVGDFVVLLLLLLLLLLSVIFLLEVEPVNAVVVLMLVCK